MGKYVMNKETQRLELHFTKMEYLALSEEMKVKIKSAFLWSNKASAWVSRSKHNHRRAEVIAKELGLENGGKVGERLSYAEELEGKVEKAEARATRYDEYSGNAEKRAVNLQADFNEYRKDWSWLTQPIMEGHAGSMAFARHREKVMARYGKGFEEYHKSEYFQRRAATARATADNSKLNDKVYLHNRIKECTKQIKYLQHLITIYEKQIYKIQNDEVIESCNFLEKYENYVEELLEKYEYEQDKLMFFKNRMQELGGVTFSKDNVKPGYIVKVKRCGKVEIVSTGPVNVVYKILEGGAAGMLLSDPYAAINEIVEVTEVKKTAKIENPYKLNDILCHYSVGGERIIRAYQVVKVTGQGVKLQRIKVEENKPLADHFWNDIQFQKRLVKSKYSEFVGVYEDDWQLHKYKTV